MLRETLSNHDRCADECPFLVGCQSERALTASATFCFKTQAVAAVVTALMIAAFAAVSSIPHEPGGGGGG